VAGDREAVQAGLHRGPVDREKPSELKAAIAEAFQHDDEVMIERFIAGRELSAPILGGEALPVGEIIPSTRSTTTNASTRPAWLRRSSPLR